MDVNPEPPPPAYQPFQEIHPDPAEGYESGVEQVPTRITARPIRSEAVDPNDPATWAGTPRNAACPCGSGKKYKKCHG